MNEDLGGDRLAAVLGNREVRTYPALLSTETDAVAWARRGAPTGAVVVADYQASPRGRGGLPWAVVPGRSLGFTLLARPDLPPEREGWPYVAAGAALSDVRGGARVAWPDTVEGPDAVEGPGRGVARLGVHVELGAAGISWITVTVLVEETSPPRGQLLAACLAALERRLAQDPEQVLGDYLARCATIGRRVRARLIPMGPGGPEVTGTAVDVRPDGALVLVTRAGSRVAVPPQSLGLLEPPGKEPTLPPDIARRLGD